MRRSWPNLSSMGGGHGGSPETKGRGREGGRLRGGGREGGASCGGCYWSTVWAARCGLLVRKNSWGRKEREGGLKKREREKNKRKEKNGKFAKPGYFREKNKR
jgi:hypothetical protein